MIYIQTIFLSFIYTANTILKYKYNKISKIYQKLEVHLFISVRNPSLNK